MEGENRHIAQQKLTFYENGWMENNWDFRRTRALLGEK